MQKIELANSRNIIFMYNVVMKKIFLTLLFILLYLTFNTQIVHAQYAEYNNYSAEQENIINSYLNNSVYKVLDEIYNPEDNDNGVSSVIHVEFIIDNNGKIINKKLLSHGTAEEEKLILDTLNKAAPFKQFPSNYKEKEIKIRYTFYSTTKNIQRFFNPSHPSQQEAVLIPYFQQNVFLKINKALKIPDDMKFNTVRFTYTIDHHGNLTDFKITSSSGNIKLDNMISDIIHNVPPFGEMPLDYKGKSVRIKANIYSNKKMLSYISQENKAEHDLQMASHFWSVSQDYDSVIKYASSAIAQNPTNDFAYYYRGTAYMENGDYQKALQDFSSAIKLNPKEVIYRQSREKAKILSK